MNTRRLALVAAAALAAVTLGACKPTPTPSTIDVVGDSITAQSYWNRDAAWLADGPGAPAGADVLKDAWLGYRFEDVQERETARVLDEEHPRPAVLVIALGTNNIGNGGWTTADEDAFTKLLNTPNPSTCVVVSLPYGNPTAIGSTRWAEWVEGREAMARIAATRPRTVVTDGWRDAILAHPEVLSTDGVHLASTDRSPANEDAAAAYASNLWAGVHSCPAT